MARWVGFVFCGDIVRCPSGTRSMPTISSNRRVASISSERKIFGLRFFARIVSFGQEERHNHQYGLYSSNPWMMSSGDCLRYNDGRRANRRISGTSGTNTWVSSVCFLPGAFYDRTMSFNVRKINKRLTRSSFFSNWFMTLHFCGFFTCFV